ncbi:hypothetical protein HEP81_03570 [Streptomyces griseofuscus]|uniref:Uncharacterized protein n=1 Tax=Streptomyces griseofuscus TaxID=146922 RepID=A0A7H1Q0P2_9ACTN|nr:hypothetical protein [Streptomyces murinus]QNT93872.1 hypothetical protein HEP81_03570 [Streptomyces griseofuscus]
MRSPGAACAQVSWGALGAVERRGASSVRDDLAESHICPYQREVSPYLEG